MELDKRTIYEDPFFDDLEVIEDLPLDNQNTTT